MSEAEPAPMSEADLESIHQSVIRWAVPPIMGDMLREIRRSRAEVEGLRAELAKLRTAPLVMRFCDRTGHLCGADTVMAGHECPCISCSVDRHHKLVRQEMDRLLTPSQSAKSPESP